EALSRQNEALVAQLASARSEIARPTERPAAAVAAELPLTILDANRTAAGAIELTVPASAGQFALWVQVDAAFAPHPPVPQISDSRGTSSKHSERFTRIDMGLWQLLFRRRTSALGRTGSGCSAKTAFSPANTLSESRTNRRFTASLRAGLLLTGCAALSAQG